MNALSELLELAPDIDIELDGQDRAFLSQHRTLEEAWIACQDATLMAAIALRFNVPEEACLRRRRAHDEIKQAARAVLDAIERLDELVRHLAQDVRARGKEAVAVELEYSTAGLPESFNRTLRRALAGAWKYALPSLAELTNRGGEHGTR